MRTFWLIVSLVLIVSCTNDADSLFESSTSLEETQLDTEMMDEEEVPLEWYTLIETLFSPANKDKVIIVRSEPDEKTDTRVYTMRYIREEEYMRSVPMLKTRSTEGEADASWTYWGDICGKLDAIKFANYVEKKYGSTTYETRFEAIDGKNCKRAYHRKGKDKMKPSN